ncbi:antibiotic biosynthesis monooxygenase [Chlorogloeopsis sp. ULAP01]|uniref:antibiotic biosynthesis monooxygenase n=1 Tax=Chlorogloeopsis sp. ULAP01 TaxID=3056483 RepID=UPI0025AAF895|nr:antibiotic biosynthesis monooxygenase [Chlorogloeopsis sp. ULAP01]MDM9381410.1 antibiotic biosynthesis monooxygenase [Chlorogloeopsis sp. ULAP01]
MSDFHDCLKHQYAYVAVGEFKPGKFEEAKQLFEQAVSMYTTGFQKAYLLQEPGTDKGIAVIFWENMGDMEANHSEAYQKILNKMSSLFAKAPTTSFNELVCEIHPGNVQRISA